MKGYTTSDESDMYIFIAGHGQTRNKDLTLADARPIAIVSIESDFTENYTIFSASSGSEI